MREERIEESDLELGRAVTMHPSWDQATGDRLPSPSSDVRIVILIRAALL